MGKGQTCCKMLCHSSDSSAYSFFFDLDSAASSPLHMANNQSKIRRFKLNPWKTKHDALKGPLQSTVVDNSTSSPSVAQTNQSQELPLASTPEIATKHVRLNRIIMGTLAKSKNILLGRSDQNIASSSDVDARVSVQIESSGTAFVQEV